MINLFCILAALMITSVSAQTTYNNPIIHADYKA